MARKAIGFDALFKVFRRSDPGDVAAIDVAHHDRVFKVALKRNSAARRFTLRVRGATGDAVLTMPLRASLGQARDFAQAHAGWLANRLARLPQRARFLPGATIPLRGIDHVLRHCPRPAPRALPGAMARRGPVWIEEVDGRPSICASGEPAHFERRVTAFLREEARRDLERAVSLHAAKAGRRPISLTLRDTSSRWGSCSARGALNFSWRLILAPPFVLDYLAAHETAHLRHHDHSEQFWALTKSLCPQTDKAEAWLKANGTQLHRYGRQAGAAGVEA
ncbi:M48 family metallopeptidase [Rhodoblastus sp.]|uniref:M48 family metallopeptidase n=1 Tax=Rhodoblastus sp. TaxID=1962975 RepID=UPI0035B17136